MSESVKVKVVEAVTKAVTETEDKPLDTALEKVDLDKSTNEIVHNIVKADNSDDLKKYTDLFNVSIAKKNALRLLKLEALLDSSVDQGIKRFEKKPDEVTNKEILEYMKVVQDLINKTHEQMNSMDGKPVIQIKNETNNVEVNVGPKLSKESKDRVIDAVKALLKEASMKPEPENVVEAEVVNKTEDVRNSNDVENKETNDANKQ